MNPRTAPENRETSDPAAAPSRAGGPGSDPAAADQTAPSDRPPSTLVERLSSALASAIGGVRERLGRVVPDDGRSAGPGGRSADDAAAYEEALRQAFRAAAPVAPARPAPRREAAVGPAPGPEPGSGVESVAPVEPGSGVESVAPVEPVLPVEPAPGVEPAPPVEPAPGVEPAPRHRAAAAQETAEALAMPPEAAAARAAEQTFEGLPIAPEPIPLEGSASAPAGSAIPAALGTDTLGATPVAAHASAEPGLDAASLEAGEVGGLEATGLAAAGFGADQTQPELDADAIEAASARLEALGLAAPPPASEPISFPPAGSGPGGTPAGSAPRTPGDTASEELLEVPESVGVAADDFFSGLVRRVERRP